MGWVDEAPSLHRLFFLVPVCWVGGAATQLRQGQAGSGAARRGQVLGCVAELRVRCLAWALLIFLLERLAVPWVPSGDPDVPTSGWQRDSSLTTLGPEVQSRDLGRGRSERLWLNSCSCHWNGGGGSEGRGPGSVVPRRHPGCSQDNRPRGSKGTIPPLLRAGPALRGSRDTDKGASDRVQAHVLGETVK